MEQPPPVPHQGAAIPPAPAGQPQMTGYATPPTNTLAVVSVAAGVASFVFLPFVGAIVAVITGHMARGQIRHTGESGSGLALAGLILGYVHLALFAILAVVVLLVLGGLGVFIASQAH